MRAVLSSFCAIIFLPAFTLLALISRFMPRKMDLGFGPDPLINHILHVKSVRERGWKAESYVNSVYYITDNFDYRVDHWPVPRLFKDSWLFIRAIFRYRILVFYFHGGPLGSTALWRLEPYLFKLAGIRTLVLPYGSDVQNMDHCANLLYKQVYAQRYLPQQRKSRRTIQQRINLWSRRADHILSGCDWVYYTPYWHTLVGAHFTVEMKNKIPTNWQQGKPLRLFHAANHVELKGTRFIEQAVKELRAEGLPVELDVAKNICNQEVLAKINQADVVIDQLIIGWYGLFSLEAMACGKPVICNLRADLLRLHELAGTFSTPVPLIQAEFSNIKDVLRSILEGQVDLGKAANQSYDFVEKHHSVKAMGEIFDRMIEAMGVKQA